MNEFARASDLARIVQAQQAAERDIAQDARREEPWTLLIECWLARGLFHKAVESALAATASIPASQALQGLLAYCRLMDHDYAQAQAVAERLWSGRPTDLSALTHIGLVATAVGQHDLSRAALGRALELHPEDPQLQFNLATALRNCGELVAAERLYDSVIRCQPKHWEAYKNRTDLRRQTPDRNHLSELAAAIGRAGSDWRGATMLHYALGKEREDLGDPDAAFAAYDTGAKLLRRHMQYSIEADLELMRRIARVFDPEWLRRQPAGCQKPEPIFIVGLPRSGSTLLERMMGAHEAIHAAGELHNFGLSVARLLQHPDRRPHVDMIGASAQLDPLQLGERYLASCRHRTGSRARFTDKLPGNFIHAGLIAAALPRAAIVHIHRDPRDAGFALYKTLFKQAYPFSYDLREIGRYIRGYQQLMEHWHRLLPGRIIDVAYEELVDDPERVLGEVFRRCHLAFDPRCLSFFQSTEAVTTASAVQVRQPIYRSSVESWRHYARHLAPLFDELGTQ
ncbi:MAG TPA: sulfotransferase [Steroidobacteraceae bacterium]|nr:sulfotransferase [Steroidobacteraceae bacterium]